MDVGWFEQYSFNPNLPKESASVVALRDYVFPYIGGVGNVTVIKTKPGEMLNDHVDSAPEEVGGMQHKFRWVVKGKKESTLLQLWVRKPPAGTSPEIRGAS